MELGRLHLIKGEDWDSKITSKMDRNLCLPRAPSALLRPGEGWVPLEGAVAQVGESKRGYSWAELGRCWSCAAPPPSAPHLRLPLLVHPVDLAPHKHTDPALAPSLLAAEKIGDEEGEAWHQGGTALRIDRAPSGFRLALPLAPLFLSVDLSLPICVRRALD